MPVLRRFALPLLLILLLLQGCTLSRAQIRRADAMVAASADRSSSCDRTDHCAIPSPLLAAATEAFAASTPQQPVHVVTLLDDTEPALAARINLVRAARRSIDVQTYIWDQDDAGQLMLDELVRAARRGVRVRILADQLSSFNDPDLLDRLAWVSPNLQVRLYNPTFHKARTQPLEFVAGILCCFMQFNQRMHNKLLLVDDAIGIAGGRNYQDRYFNWDDAFNYIDRDAMVGGPAALQMAASFELFWNHPRSLPLTHLRDVNRRILTERAPPSWPAPHYRRPTRVARVQEDAEDPAWLQAWLVDASLRVGQVEYFSDLPAKTDKPDKRRALEFTHHIMHMIGEAKHEVLLQTPYLVMSKRAQHIFRTLHRRAEPPRVIVSTSSLASTDAFAAYAMSYKHRKRYLKKFGFEVHELKPHAPSAGEDYELANLGMPATHLPSKVAGVRPFSETRLHLLGSRGSNNRPAPLQSGGMRFGLHAKSIVVDDAFAMVGSHNFDPRSDHYNTESGVIVYDHDFAGQLRRSILRSTQPENAWVIAPRQPKVPMLTDINQAIGSFSESLPLFDLWPFRYATSYDLKPGCQPLRATDPNFYACYEPVGDFPDVALSPKLIITRLITAFGVGAKGIL
ncbi:MULTISPECIES: phospholipase D-like domain-containing protein [Rhodanobacter]|uniref:phospholipase D-like domain-containing protein n=2 Tax=Rhodanobacteraceae TaxID=1775411 RepID=UPI001202F0AA|nr:phosphatidylserine/phosphatidylglycerophosphate/cardiolipin synthase family protein [Rhodanobacter thiooxydans]TAN17795.1 MAG: phosphatidylserine/phosphatidylglycerophosphate/cardiolipin synthase family protein [Rhodanobacter sp.]UJJ54798.1 phosphatidylserine/phosphatidylglycerophosphate/cardiolipin synthase family protein [Rhodanobacter thiooxydans]